MDGSSSSYIMLVVMIVVFGGMMWWQSKKSKQAQQEKQDFRRNLQPGTEVITIGQVIARSSKSMNSTRRSSSTPKAPGFASVSMPSPASMCVLPTCLTTKLTRTATH